MQKSYKDKEKINRVIDILLHKGIDVFYSLNDHTTTLINEEDFRLIGVEIFNKDQNSNSIFSQEIEILSSIENINRAIYILLDSKSQIPEHLDDDDQSYRILTGVVVPDKVEFVILNNIKILQSNQSIGFEANKNVHRLINYGNYPCTFLIICLSKNPFQNNDLIEIS